MSTKISKLLVHYNHSWLSTIIGNKTLDVMMEVWSSSLEGAETGQAGYVVDSDPAYVMNKLIC